MSDVVSKVQQAWAIPIPERKDPPALLRTATFAVFFNASIILTNLTQFIASPLYILPITRPLYESAIAYTKLGFGRLIVAISQLFGPTRLVITYQREDGSVGDANEILRRSKKGAFQGLQLPSKSVWMSNHQVYTDWLYLWNVAYFADLADSIIIILKDSLKWIPFVGWGMIFFRFIFLSRSWSKDQATLGRHLRFMSSGANTKRSTASKLLLLIFPEGTLVSKLTRPTSRAFAEKQRFADCRNLLLPRSTGILFCLRELLAQTPDLKLVDFTIGYPGIPPAGYGQSYYTLRSIFMQGVSPPYVHLHLRVSDAQSVPLGVVTPIKNSSGETTGVQDAMDEEKAAFDVWLREDRWRKKDDLMDRFYRDGDFVGGRHKRERQATGVDNSTGKEIYVAKDSSYVEIPVHLRGLREIGDLFCWFTPVFAGFASWHAYQYLARRS
ncbi:Lysophosphatidic acid acyltransferase LPAAT and related acyltransferases [Ceraceosorus bombacis]|uniref:Lysophosphatidic acid acyltransferase LPAAT and related acyltransferases n=1 Tax=Ceraceosorus bombacis TaxID=401625 RepID=A0A0P1BCD4_9BASI|nr:Lysophosphatidic acid acyltransferase LPAAT and related acyltransferases [Ceraceosorus bombacis]